MGKILQKAKVLGDIAQLMPVKIRINKEV